MNTLYEYLLCTVCLHLIPVSPEFLLKVALTGIEVTCGRVSRPFRVRYDAEHANARGYGTVDWVCVQSILVTVCRTDLTGNRTDHLRYGTDCHMYRA